MAYYGLGTKTNILNDLEIQILKVTGIKHVEWQRTDPRGIAPQLYPGCFINDLRTDREQKLGDIWKNILTVVIVGFVWAQAGENLGSKMNTFMNSIKTKILIDPCRDSNARDTDVDVIATDGGSHHPQGQFMMTLTITFYSSD